MVNSTNYDNTYSVYDYTSSYSTTPLIAYSYSAAPTSRIVYAGNMEPSTPVYIPPTPPIATYAAPLVYPECPVSPPANNYYTSPASTVIKTEARKLIITQLPHSTSTLDLRDLLFNAISKLSGSYCYEAVEDVEIATHADGTPRGHAFAIFESYSLAKSMVKSLNGLKFKGRTLQARFAKEGVEASTRHYSLLPEEAYPASPLKDNTQALLTGMSGASHNRPSKSSKGKESATGHIPSLTSYHASPSSDRKSTKETSSEKKEKNNKLNSTESAHKKKLSTSMDPPIVVDGSSSRKHHK